MWPDRSELRDVTGVILAGGKSTRMGRDKLLLPVDGLPLFERMLALMDGLFSRVIVAGDRPDLARPGVPCLPDRYPGSALGGLYTGLRAAETPFVFAAASDMPYPDPTLAYALLRERAGADVVLVRTPSGFEPLFALYGKGCLQPMRAALKARRFRIIDLYEHLVVRTLGPNDLPAGWQRALSNLNTAHDYERATARRVA